MKPKNCDMCGRFIDSYFAKHNLDKRHVVLYEYDENGKEREIRKACRRCFLVFAKSKKSWPTRDYLGDYLSDKDDPYQKSEAILS